MRRISENNEVISDILQILNRADKPLGAGSIKRELSRSISMSQASVGIILRDLQDRNFVERQGYKGHTITPDGQKFLLEHANRQKQTHLIGQLIKRLSVNKAECLIDILEARRAVETGVARLAAKRATAAEIQALTRNFEALARESGNIPKVRELDSEFHSLLRQTARSPLLIAMFELYEEVTFTPEGRKFDPLKNQALNEITEFLSEDHGRVMKAIADRDSAAAEKAMGKHMDRYINFIVQETETPD